jgi:hypothetical protein
MLGLGVHIGQIMTVPAQKITKVLPNSFTIVFGDHNVDLRVCKSARVLVLTLRSGVSISMRHLITSSFLLFQRPGSSLTYSCTFTTRTTLWIRTPPLKNLRWICFSSTFTQVASSTSLSECRSHIISRTYPLFLMIFCGIFNC